MKSGSTRWMLGVLLCCGACREVTAPEMLPEQGQQGTAGSAADPGAAGEEGAAGAASSPAVAPTRLECDLPTEEVSCAGVVCPASTADQALLCVVPCCTADDACGIQGRVVGQPATECMVELDAQPDPRCPNDAFVDGSEGVGCCTGAGQCGLIDPVFGLGCVERSKVYGVTLETLDCDRGAQE